MKTPAELDLERRAPSRGLIEFRNRVVATVVAVCCIVFISTFFLTLVFSMQEVSQVRERLDQTVADRELDEDQEACRNLYVGDLIQALALSQIANNNMWITVAGRDAALSDEDIVAAAEENNRLGEELNASGQPLTATVEALEAYTAITPRPLECPHPQWKGPLTERSTTDS